MLDKESAQKILQVSASLQRTAEQELRYQGNPHVEGDRITDHTYRTMRLATYSIPYLLEEFPEEQDQIYKLLPILLVHDDGELAGEGDIPTFLKDEDTQGPVEEQTVASITHPLPPASRQHALELFQAYQEQYTLAAKLAKVFDRLASNERVIEQVLGIIHPDHTALTITYIQSQLGTSQTTDNLIRAQVENIHKTRQRLKSSPEELQQLAHQHATELEINPQDLLETTQKMLEIKIDTFSAQRERAYTPTQNYYL